ncbi:MAG TPA: hypothetical protein VF116_05230 [Ktedonobacterales bacterium]
MQCPRCGYPNEPLAAWCVQCGLTFSTEQASQPSAPSMGQFPDITWRDGGGQSAAREQDEERPSWLLDALRHGEIAPTPGPRQSQDDGQSAPPAMSSPSGYSRPQPPLPDGFGTPANPSTPYPYSYPPSAPTPSGSGAPFSYPAAPSIPAPPGGSPGRMIVDAWPASNAGTSYAPVPAGAVVPASVPAPPSQALVPTLPAGSMLKNGRYRVTQRMHTASSQSAAPNEPPLMIASDTELGNERVLVQELPIPASHAAEMEGWRRACAERFAALTQQVGAPRLIDQFAEAGRHFLVYELPAGDLLSDRLQRTRGALDEKQAIGIMLQVLDVLAIYERQYPTFIHGDICPANIILRPSGQVALIGFSSALLLYPDGHVPQGAAGGAPGYGAPEQTRGQASPRSDLFSVCAVLHRCVTGVVPSPRSRGMFTAARQANPNVSLELEDVLSQGLRLASTQRFQTSRELRAALEPLVRGQLTHVPDELRGDDEPAQLLPVRDARGRLVLPRKARNQSPALILALIVLLIALVGGTTLYVLSPHGGRSGAMATPTTNDSTQLFQTKGIGLSGGEYIFDTSGMNSAAKQQGAQALNAGDLATAEGAFLQAQRQEQDDPEAAIYAEDVRVLQSGAPYVTVVAAVSYADLDETRAVLQGIYLAQDRANGNDVLPAGLRVRVLILNSGQDDSSASTAAALLLQQTQRGNAQHLIGIVGWPESAETQAALSTLAPSGLALLSPTATGDHLGGRAAVFFPLVPSDAQQAQELAQAAATQLNARQVLVLSDSASPTSVEEGKSFLSTISQFGTVAAQAASYTSGDESSLQRAAQQSAQRGADLIFLACGDTGCDNDSLLLAHAVAGIDGTGNNAPRILVTHQAYTPALLGMGSDPVATYARNNANVLQLLDVTQLANVNEWLKTNVPSNKQPTFASDWVDRFGSRPLPNGLQGPSAESILGYDALRLLLSASKGLYKLQGTTITYPTPTQVRNGLLQINAGNPFVGVGGAVAFSDTGDLVGKSLYIASLAPQANPGSDQPVALPQFVAITGTIQDFCGSSCTPS